MEYIDDVIVSPRGIFNKTHPSLSNTAAPHLDTIFLSFFLSFVGSDKSYLTRVGKNAAACKSSTAPPAGPSDLNVKPQQQPASPKFMEKPIESTNAYIHFVPTRLARIRPDFTDVRHGMISGGVSGGQGCYRPTRGKWNGTHPIP